MTLIDFKVEIDFVEMLDKIDPLVDRGCVMLDGQCNCKRQEGKSFPDCEKYPPINT